MSSHLEPEHCGSRAVAERSMSSPSGARTWQVPCGRGALDVFTAWGPNRAVAERSMSSPPGARTLRVPCARCLDHLGPELWRAS